jgi:hypothetical protein
MSPSNLSACGFLDASAAAQDKTIADTIVAVRIGRQAFRFMALSFSGAGMDLTPRRQAFDVRG